MGKNTTLDLHGVRHHEVDRLVENFIFMNQDLLPLKIICGNSQVMIDLVFTVIKRHKITVASMDHYGVVDIYKL
jgi:hypothetical protein